MSLMLLPAAAVVAAIARSSTHLHLNTTNRRSRWPLMAPLARGR